MKQFLVTGLVTIFSSAGVFAAEPIKLSSSGICHTPESSYYSRTKSFTPYDTIEACLAAGGKLPKGQSTLSSKQADAGEFDRERYFGHGWADEDKDCQDTRHELLIETSTAPVRFKDDDECVVVFGRWISMYTGEVIFDAPKMDIDHIVPLKWAWGHGADKWSQEKRVQFANDPINLVAVEASLNRSKGAKGLDEWLPPANQEQYKARFMRIITKYQLSK